MPTVHLLGPYVWPVGPSLWSLFGVQSMYRATLDAYEKTKPKRPLHAHHQFFDSGLATAWV